MTFTASRYEQQIFISDWACGISPFAGRRAKFVPEIVRPYLHSCVLVQAAQFSAGTNGKHEITQNQRRGNGPGDVHILKPVKLFPYRFRIGMLPERLATF